jgi:prepilin-type N-terminal cleavage/methylation domain-containing protein
MKNSPSDDQAMRGAFTLVELLVVIAILGVLTSLLLPVIGRSKSKAHNAVCVGQLRQLGIATRLYADENENVLPIAELLPSMPVDASAPRPRICDVLGPYVGKVKSGTNSLPVFHCPADRIGRFEKEGNTTLNGRRMDETFTSQVQFSANYDGNGSQPWQTNGTLQLRFPPETTALLLDYQEFHPRPPKSGKNVVFMDNHVSQLESSRLN